MLARGCGVISKSRVWGRGVAPVMFGAMTNVRGMANIVIEEEALRPSSALGTIGSVLDYQVARNHLRRAVHVTEQPLSKWSFGELKRQVDAFANGLLQLNFEAGDKLAIAMPNNIENVVALLAAAKIGVIVIPLGESPSKDTLQKVLESGVTGLMFTDIVGNVNYADMLLELVPEVDDFRQCEMHGLPFRSLKFPKLRYLISTDAHTRVPGMHRFQWVALYDFDSNLRRTTKNLTADTPFILDFESGKVTTHGEIITMSKSIIPVSSIDSNDIVSVLAPLTNAKNFACCIASHLSGAMCVFSHTFKESSYDMIMQIIKPNVLISDNERLRVLCDKKSVSPVNRLILVDNCDASHIERAQSNFKPSQVTNL